MATLSNPASRDKKRPAILTMWLFMSRHARAQGCKTQTLGPESVKAFMLWIFNTVDTKLARRMMGLGEKRTEVGGQKTAS